MKLAIEINRSFRITHFILTDQEQADGKGIFITSDELAIIKTLKWYLPLKSTDIDSLLDNCTSNQQIVAIYFYIDTFTVSEALMIQWFIDAGCSVVLAENLSVLVKKARLAMAGEDSQSIPDQISDWKNSTTNHSIIEDSKKIQLSDILYMMKSGEHIQWAFDSFPSVTATVNKYIDLSQIVECTFIVEDHHSIINGFSVKYKDFLETVAVSNTNLLKNLCNYVTLGKRDLVSLGRAIINNPAILQDIKMSGYTAIKFFGLDPDGKLNEYPHGFDISDNCFSTFNNNDQLLPLFIKFIKTQEL